MATYSLYVYKHAGWFRKRWRCIRIVQDLPTFSEADNEAQRIFASRLSGEYRFEIYNEVQLICKSEISL